MEETILNRINCQVEEINRAGCNYGKVHDEKISIAQKYIDELKTLYLATDKKIEEINGKLFYSLIIFIVIGIMAGINVSNIILGWIK